MNKNTFCVRDVESLSAGEVVGKFEELYSEGIEQPLKKGESVYSIQGSAKNNCSGNYCR